MDSLIVKHGQSPTLHTHTAHIVMVEYSQHTLSLEYSQEATLNVINGAQWTVSHTAHIVPRV